MLRCLLLALAFGASALAQIPAPDWSKIDAETLEHFQNLVRLDTTNPPGNEFRAVEYLKKILEKEGIAVQLFAKDPQRPNLVARLAGSGKKKPLLILGHTDTVSIDRKKWKHDPFGAEREGGYIYGRGTVDDKDNLTACLMTMLLLKRLGVPLDRDVIFLAEAGEETGVQFGIQFMTEEHWKEIDAEYCIAEGGSVARRKGKVHYATVQTAEKTPYNVRLIAHGPAGHGSRPLRSNAVAHLSTAVSKAAAWMPPMRLNDTTRYYFEKLATISNPEEAARYSNLTNPEKTGEIQEYFADYEPAHNSMLRTSVSPNIFRAGYQINVIPSEAEAQLDVRALPDENLPQFLEELKKVIGDPSVEVVLGTRNTRPLAAPSRLDSEVYKALEGAGARAYPGAITMPTMATGATDMSFLRAKGMQCYGVGPAIDVEDGPLGFGAHSDQERILESSLRTFIHYTWDAVSAVAAAR